MKLIYGSLQFAAIWIVLTSARAQQSQVSFQHFNVEDGLSQGSITAILQDHQGFIWIGTENGSFVRSMLTSGRRQKCFANPILIPRLR